MVSTCVRRFVYATVLAVTTLNFAPSLASAQERASGRFTLPHDVYWQNAFVPAGEYHFYYDSGAGLGVLTLSGLSGGRNSFMLLVRDQDDAKLTDLSRLVVEKTSAGSYVEALQLPDFGMTLHFAAPSSMKEKQMAKAVTATVSPAR
jgi:hypothetical protein